MAEYFVSGEGVAVHADGSTVAEQVMLLQAKRQLLEAENANREIREVDMQLKLVQDQRAMESLRLANAEFVNRWDYLPVGYDFGSPFGYSPYGGTFTYSSPNDRYEGRDYPFVVSEQDLNYARGLARFIAKTHCPGVAVERILKAHIIGAGGNYTAGKRKNSKVDDAVLDAIQDVIDEFVEENKIIGEGEQEWFWRGVRDGETFLALSPMRSGHGIVDAREIDPPNVRDPGHEIFSPEVLQQRYGMFVQCATNWTWGIHKAEHDVQKIFGYVVDWDGSSTDWSYYPSAFMEHWKRNVDRNVSRGLTDFFPCWQWIKEQHRLLTNTSAGAAERSAISYIIEHVEGVQKSQAVSMRQTQADYSYTIQGPLGNSNTIYKEWRPPGTKLDVPKGQTYVAIANGTDPSPSYLQVVQAILRQVATIWSMTEGAISGDDSGNSVTSAVVAGSRFDKYGTMEQGSFAAFMGRILWKVLRVAFQKGRFAKYGFGPTSGSWQKLKRVIEIIVKYPDVSNRDPLQLEQLRQMRQQAQIVSKKTWSDEIDLDYETEQANIQKEQPQGQPGMPGAGGGMPPEMGGGGAPPQVGGEEEGMEAMGGAAPQGGGVELPALKPETSTGGLIAYRKPNGGIGYRQPPGMGANYGREELVADVVNLALEKLQQAQPARRKQRYYRVLTLANPSELRSGDVLRESGEIAVTSVRTVCEQIAAQIADSYVVRISGAKPKEIGADLVLPQGHFVVEKVRRRNGIGYIEARFVAE